MEVYYIRIVKVRFSDKHHMINDLLQNPKDQLSEVFTLDPAAFLMKNHHRNVREI